MSKSKRNVHGPAVKALTPVEYKTGQQADVNWPYLHNFANTNIRVDSFADPLSDLQEQVRDLRAAKDDKAAETDADRKTTAKGLVAKLFGGWDQDVHRIPATIATVDEQKRAVAERRTQIENWRVLGTNEKTAVYGRLANFVQPFWFPNGFDGPATLPALITHDGHRRLFAAPAAAFARAHRHIDESGHLPIAVTVRGPLTEQEEVMVRVKGNLGHEIGRSDVSALDFVKIAYRLYHCTPQGREVDLLPFGKKSMVRVGFAIAQIDDLYREVNLYKRLMLAKPDKAEQYVPGESYIALEKISAWNDLQSIKTDVDWEQTKKVSERDGKAYDAAEIERWIATRMGGTAGAAAFSGADFKKLRGGDYTLPLNVIALCMEEKNRTALKVFDQQYGKTMQEALLAADFDLKMFKKEALGMK